MARRTVVECLAERRRRELLALLLDRVSPVAERELAIHLVAAERDKSIIEVTPDEVRTLLVELRHVHLPALEGAALVDWDREESTVTTTGHPALRDPHLRTIVETEAEGWDAVVASLADARRRVVLSALADRDDPLSRAELTREVLARDPDLDEEEVRVSLHHVHLPKLADAGLVEYDADADAVSYEGHPDLDEEWLGITPSDPPRSVLASARRSPDIWTIDGGANVREHGRSLVDGAEGEVFLMFSSDALLEPECIRALENAADRGVDVYLGAQSEEVRDLVRERAPEIVIWEPQLDWLNLQPERGKVGRLVFADREAVMLATLGARTDDGERRETAITGAGEDNALVVMVRELLSSRLDHLDAQSEDFLSQLKL